MGADDYLSEWFEDTHIKAVLAYCSGLGTLAGPKTPGSAYVIMHHVMGEHAGAGGWGFVRGGMGTITQAIAKAGREKGLEIRTSAPVASIDLSGGRATGVTLEDGARIEAGFLASNVSAKLTFLKFLPEDALPAEFVRDLRGYRTYSAAFKINIACERPRTTIYVTHDQEEALVMSDRIAVMRAGRIVQVGSALDLYERPADGFVARFLGESNLLAGRVTALHDGGRGYMRENPVERLYRDVRVDRIWKGTSEIQRVIIGGQVARRGTGAFTQWPGQSSRKDPT